MAEYAVAKIVDLFPLTFDIVKEHQRWWGHEVDWSEEENSFKFFLCFIQGEQNHAMMVSRDFYVALSMALLQDIIQIKSAKYLQHLRVEFNYLQFFVASGPAVFLERNGEYTSAHDWFNYCLSDDIPANVVQKLEFDRLFEFYALRIVFLRDAFIQFLMDWVASFFHYSRVWNVHRDAANEIFGFCERLVADAISKGLNENSSQTLDESTSAAAMMVNWAVWHAHQRIENLSALLHQIIENEKVNRRIRAKIGVLFSTECGKATCLAPKDWATETLNQFGDVLEGHERLQLLCMIAPGALTEALLKEISDEICRVRREVYRDHHSGDPIAVYRKDRLFGILSPLLLELIRTGRSEEILKVLSWWEGVPEANTLVRVPLFIFPNDGFIVTGSGDVVSIDREEKATVEAMVAISNSFLRTAVTVTHSQQQLERISDITRSGVPDSDHARMFLEMLQDFYGFSRQAE